MPVARNRSKWLVHVYTRETSSAVKSYGILPAYWRLQVTAVELVSEDAVRTAQQTHCLHYINQPLNSSQRNVLAFCGNRTNHINAAAWVSGISAFHDDLFNTIVSICCDWFQQIEMRPRGRLTGCVISQKTEDGRLTAFVCYGMRFFFLYLVHSMLPRMFIFR